jgi:hypothetical protein
VVVSHVKVRTAPDVTENRTSTVPGNRNDVVPPRRFCRITQIEFVFHEEVSHGKMTVHVLADGVVVIVVEVVDNVIASLERSSVVKFTAVIVKVKGTARAADAAGSSAYASVSVVVVRVLVEAEQSFFLRQFLLGDVNEILEGAVSRRVEVVPIVEPVRRGDACKNNYSC